MTKVLVTGAGGALAGHLVKRLLEQGHEVRCVDVKPLDDWWQWHREADNYTADLRRFPACLTACDDIEDVYNLACDMGGVGYIVSHKFDCMKSGDIVSHMLEASLYFGVSKVFQSSSACVYNVDKQQDPNNLGLKEEDAWPAKPEPGYGHEKLNGELLCQYAYEDYGLQTRVARLHNVYSTFGTWRGGREKAPAAICRKVAIAKLTNNYEIEVWGDGKATRTYMWVDDFVEGTLRIMGSHFHHPLNLGSNELISVNDLVAMVAEIAGVEGLKVHHDLSGPQGVKGRSSDNTLIQEVLGWQPRTSLREGLEKLYLWVEDRVRSDM